MIILDTNVVSEAMKPEPNLSVQTLAECSSRRNTLFIQHYTGRTVIWHRSAPSW